MKRLCFLLVFGLLANGALGQQTQFTTQSPEIAQCIRRCPVTAEYNPVCGTNDVTYNNPGRLICAQMCKVKVSVKRKGRCEIPLPEE